MNKQTEKRINLLIDTFSEISKEIDNDPLIQQLRKIREQLENRELQLLNKVISCKEELEDIFNAEQGSWEDKSEKWQQGEKGQEVQEQLQKLEGIVTDLDGVISTLEDLDLREVFESIEGAESSITDAGTALEEYLNEA